MAHENTSHLVTYVTQEEQKRLRLRAAEAGVSISSYLRDVVREHLDKTPEPTQARPA